MKTKNTFFIMMMWILAVSSTLDSQAQGLFQLNGNGGQADLGNNCYRLTQTVNNQFGSIWYRKKADLTQDFDLQANLNFGTNDASGADGIVFAFQNQCTSSGSTGGSIGIGGVSPSLLVEFDTWQNTNFGDPTFDHVAILNNGSVAHGSSNSLVAPVGILPNNGNVENGQDFLCRFLWTAATQTLEVYVNNNLRVSYTGNVIQDIFNGDPYVYWGFTAATGGSTNIHRVCIVEFPDNEVKLNDITICEGESQQVNLPGGVSYSWTPSTFISSTSVANPTLFPPTTTTYIVSITDACNNVQTDSLTVFVNALPQVSLSVPQSSICSSEPALSLTGGLPAGGSYSGSGVSGSTFNPANANTGPNTIQYTFVDTNGCSNTASSVITVNTSPLVSLAPFNSVCENAPSFSLSGGQPLGGSYAGNGVSSGVFNPTLAGAGSTTITYSVIDNNGCAGSATGNITVFAQPVATISSSSGAVICDGASTTLSVSTTTGASYEWFLNGNSVTSNSPNNTTYTASTPGNYTVTVTSANNCQSTSSAFSVTTGSASNATINALQTSFCSGSSVNLSTTVQAGESVQWYFNNNAVSGGTQPTLTASQGGSYYVMITSTSGCTSSSTTVTITENQLPQTTINATAPAFCPGISSIAITAPSQAGANYQWLLNGNTISGATNATYAATQAGDYSVVVTAANGCSATSAAVTLSQGTAPSVSISSPYTTFCQGSNVLITATNISGGSYSWQLNGNTVSGTGNTLQANQPGDYTVIVTNAQQCSGASNTLSITQQAAPNASISSNGTTVCQGQSLTLIANVVAGATYEWFRNNVSLGAPSSANTFNATQNGTYYVVVNDGCSATSNSITLTVSNLPGNAGTIIGWDEICPGEVITYNVNNVTGATSYLWEIIPNTAGTINTGQGSNSVVVNWLNQNAQIKVTPQNACGSGNSNQKNITTNSPFCFGQVQFGGYPTNICQGNTVTFYNYTQSGSFPMSTISWNFGSGASPATATGNGPHTVTYNTTGNKTVTLSYIDQFSGFVIDEEIRNNYVIVGAPLVTPPISGNSTLSTCVGVTEIYSVTNNPGSTYQWTVPANAVINSGQGTNQVSVTFNGSGGTISVVQTSTSNCQSNPVNLFVDCVLSIDQLEQQQSQPSISLFPNPVKETINLRIERMESTVFGIEIADLNGRIIYRLDNQYNSSDYQTSIDVSQFPTGMYFVRIISNKQVSNAKFIKQ
jgi:hypothetical protein